MQCEQYKVIGLLILTVVFDVEIIFKFILFVCL